MFAISLLPRSSLSTLLNRFGQINHIKWFKNINSAQTKYIRPEGSCVITLCVVAFIQIKSDWIRGTRHLEETAPDGWE